MRACSPDRRSATQPPETLACPAVFEGRWVSLPEGTGLLAPGTLPDGFRAAGVAAGIKPSGREDFGVIVSDREGTTSSARFTTSSAPAAPVQVCRERVALGGIRAIAVNSGNANAATGGLGRDNAFYMQGAAALVARVPEELVAVASTGVIGQQLDTRAISKGASLVSRELTNSNAISFAAAICTTDRWLKTASLRVDLSGGPVTLSAQAKGAGMIAPMHAPHATLLAFVQTDAILSAEQCDELLGSAVARSFDRVSVDAQLSTNDSVFLQASGAAAVVAEPGSADEARFAAALDALLMALAISVVRDGEGAGRIARVNVVGGDAVLCERTARAIADSPLVKTALSGGDPNWGRIMQAAGMALGTGRPESIDIEIEGVDVAKNGAALRFDEGRLAEAVAGPEVEYSVRLAGAGHEAVVYFSDLGHDYVTLNAEYTT